MKVLDLRNKKFMDFTAKRDAAKEKISKLEGRSLETLQTEIQRGKKWTKLLES